MKLDHSADNLHPAAEATRPRRWVIVATMPVPPLRVATTTACTKVP
jgi:hypothetical protein